MSCNKNCPHMGRGARGVPRQRLDAVRRKLEFSDEVSETSHIQPPPANKYEHFKNVSESHSSHIMEPPMYSGAQLASVPDSFLEAFAGKRDFAAAGPSRRKPVPPPCEESAEVEMPDSFLEFCQAKIAARPPPSASQPKTPPRRPTSEGSYCAPCPSAYSSVYGYEDPAAIHGMIGSPRISPNQMSPKKSPPKSPQPEYYYPPPFKYYRRPPSFEREAPYNAPGTGAVGLGRYAYPASSSPPTPPTPASACPGQCAKSGTYGDSTVSSGDLMGSSSKKMGSYRYPTPPPGAVGIGKYAYPHSQHSATPPTPPSTCAGACGRSSTFEESMVGPPQAQSTPVSPQFRYDMNSVRSSSSIPGNRRRQPDTVCSDDLLGSGKSSPRCPTLGVTPVHSGVSVSSSGGNMASGKRQNISKSIETELRAREVQERNQLECDLARWQEARRRLVMNTANMGS